VIEDIRTYARLQLGISGMTREEYIAAVLAYAIEKHGDGQETKMLAERTARYFWAARPGAPKGQDGGLR
jgi:hypothetical protein